MPRLKLPLGEVGEALDRVLGSETFARSGRARDLLRYIVAREQAGEAEALKGYAIALDVFGRDEAFDPSTDAVVRVQARRLRDLLALYYEMEGAGDPLRIEVPRGSYIPTYTSGAPGGALQRLSDSPAADPRGENTPADVVSAGMTAPALAIPQQSRVLRHLRLFWLAMGAVILLLGFVAYRVGGDGSETGSQARAIALAELLPTVRVDTSGADDDIVRVGAIIRGALAGFDTVDLVVQQSEAADAAGRDATDFLFLVSRAPGGGLVRVELGHVATARNLATRDIDPENAADSVADMLTSAAPVSGSIYAFLAANGLESPLAECLLLNHYFYRDPSEDLFIPAYECVRTLETQGLKSPLVFAELASLELQGITSRYGYADDFSRARALECARKAIELGPTSPYAHRAYGFLLLRLGSDGEGLSWMRKAYELNTFDLSMAASYAYALVFSGAYDEAAPILKRAVRASSSHPGWWNYALFLAEFMLDNMTGAADASLALETTMRAHYLAARMIVAHRAGDMATADALRASILKEYPSFALDPQQYFLDARYPADLAKKLADAVRAAGLVSAS